MKEPKLKSVIIFPHSPNCNYIGTGENPWSGIIDGSYAGNFKGNINVKVGRHHTWYRVLCNCINCTGIKAVHSWVLINEGEKKEDSPIVNKMKKYLAASESI